MYSNNIYRWFVYFVIIFFAYSGCDNTNYSSNIEELLLLLDKIGAGPSYTSTAIKKDILPVGSQQCPNGGITVSTGIDRNRNGVLDNNEITNTQYLCNGSDGATGLINATNESNVQQCSNGGIKIDLGLDSNANGILDQDEITKTTYICNGNDGLAGATGLNSLYKLTQEQAGINCTTGGNKIETGLDKNNDGVLEQDEITEVSYICNGLTGSPGAPGLNSQVKVTIEPVGANCASGGNKIETGLDANNDGVLNQVEVVSVSYICKNHDYFSVKDYGAKGDGSDATNAVQATIDACLNSGGGKIYFPSGSYLISRPLIINKQLPIEIAGDGSSSLILWHNNGHLFDWTSECDDSSIHDLKIILTSEKSDSAYAAFLFGNGTFRSKFENILIDAGGYSIPSGLAFYNITDTILIENCIFWGVKGTGIRIGHGSEVRINGGRIIGNNRASGSVGIHLTGYNGGVHLTD